MPRLGSHLFSLRDFVKETTQTSGTGAYQLDGVSEPEEGHQSFLTAVGDGQKTIYAVKRAGTWEKAIGTVSAGAPVTLSRDLILGTSADDTIGADPIDWPSTDPKDIWIGDPADLLNLIQGPGETLWGGVATGGNDQVITVNAAVTTYFNGLTVIWQKDASASTGNMSLDINSIGAADLLKAIGTEVPPGEVPASALMVATYVASASAFVLLAGLKRLGATKGETRVYTSGDTWSKPAGLLFAKVKVQADGGAGGGCNQTTGSQNSNGGGGGGGEYAEGILLAGDLGDTETVTIGSGGAGSSGSAGGNGTGASFGSHITAAGGSGGSNGTATDSNATAAPGAGGTGGSGGSIRIPGSDGGRGRVTDGEAHLSGVGGGSHMGGSTASPTTGNAGNAGKVYGGGGSGAANGGGDGNNRAGGNGAGALVIVEEYFS